MTEQLASKQLVIERFCSLAKEVGEAHKCMLAHDCFCGHPDSYVGAPDDFRFEVMEFIESAVREKIARMNHE